MNTLPLTPSNPQFNNFVQVIEPTILRYTKNGRWYEIHLETRMLSMFGYERGESFETLPNSVLHSIIYNFHDTAFDCTQEVAEEVENEGYAFHLILT